MKYFGDATCIPCRETKKLLDEYGIRYDFVNVQGLPEYENHTPLLELDDGTLLEGEKRILDWLGMMIG